ncbi:hypothetical protein NEPAR06_2300 [Nematocida parisii]|uniref:Uncharacterized protein n=1 Tax=Nematocida parisii (strain ERTm3) TaxID=935791 RepID=I3EFW6_NEMP3|nr:uncharacterized protein NEPG_01393 [Nematocida parisii ERTm1]EIJ88113.1 hypothetical protein NEQG_01557 [Nematocida parisii ERTm3]KAI5131635.1 hypothetical protein NEPAR03_2501 [Nematocida parisii]EIJ93821.1 hypothetical protein NEPG_01393 [Nematocida parisii ERTm1]KAI5131645.1 hypothetical protein NEPAR08_2542 [Nematocida parisii]KAI5146062.1 hypothetical protein NEPAR04_2554 [Nematocida parisii]|eukprot:XP_013059221.1 hypothetical protein NEPG_01393 [Nematocida parisii ERTm1]
MANYIIDEIKIRAELQKEFKNKNGKMNYADTDKLFIIIAGINKEKRIFTEVAEPLANLAYNILYKQLFGRIIYIYYNEEDIISKLHEALRHIDLFVDIIKELADELDSDEKKEAFYRIIGNSYLLMAEGYIFRKELLDSAINTLCEKEEILKLNDEVTSTYAIAKLCELTESKECSRFKRALDILVKHGDNLIITDKNGEKQSNISNLEITKDDIYSLQLLTKTESYDIRNLIYFLDGSICKSMYNLGFIRLFLLYSNLVIKMDKNDIYFYICRLYVNIFNMFIRSNQNILNIESYKQKHKNIFKSYLNQIFKKRIEDIDIGNEKLSIFNTIKNHQYINMEDIKNNLLKKHFESIESDIATIGPFTFRSKGPSYLKIIAVILIIISIIILSIFLLYPSGIKEIMNN